MKRIIRYWFIYLLSLLFVSSIITSISYSGGWQTVAIVSFLITLFELILKPIIRILLLPINILTLGLARSLTNVIGLYLITSLVADFKISTYFFPGVSWNGFSAPPATPSLLLTYLIISLLLNLSFSIILWIVKK
jgi:putative membrane protein